MMLDMAGGFITVERGTVEVKVRSVPTGLSDLKRAQQNKKFQKPLSLELLATQKCVTQLLLRL